MAGVVRIEVDLEGNEKAAQGVRNLRGEIEKLPQGAGTAGAAMTRTADDIRKASDAADIMAQRVGVVLPEAVRRFIAETKGVGSVLQKAFQVSIYAAIGYEILRMANNMGLIPEKITDIFTQTQRWREEHERLNKEIAETNRQIEEIYRKNQLIGRSGVAAAAMTVQQIDLDIEKMRLQYRILEDERKRIEEKAIQRVVLRARGLGGIGGAGITGAGLTVADVTEKERAKILRDSDEYQAALDKVEKIETNINKLLLQREGLQKQINIQLGEETKKREEILRQTESKRKRPSPYDYRTPGTADTFGFIMPAYDFAADDAFAESYFQKLKADAQSLQSTNESMMLSIMRQKKDYLGILDIELDKIEELKEKYAGNADAISALEERKKLIVMQTNEEIARDAETKFDQTATAIEGFFNRTFLTARSFSDVWKQLWTQLVNYSISQIAKLVAAWWTGNQSMSQASTGGGGPSGMIQGINAVTSFLGIGGQGGGGTPVGSYSALPMSAGKTEGSYTGTSISATGAVAAGSSVSYTGGPYRWIGYGKGAPDWYSNLSAGQQRAMNAGIAASGLLGSYLAERGRRSDDIGMSAFGSSMQWASIGYQYGGGWGALAGGIGGAIYGAFAAGSESSKRDAEAASIAAQARNEMTKIWQAYSLHQIPYDQALSSLSNVYTTANSDLNSIGRSSFFDRVLSAYQEFSPKIRNAEKNRKERIGVMEGLPEVEFASGSNGILNTGQGRFAATVEDGEAVLNSRAAASLGDSNIRALNRGSMFGLAGINITINAVDAKSFVELVENNRGVFVQLIRRAALDQGLPAPV